MFTKSFKGQIVLILAMLALSIGSTMRVMDGTHLRAIQVVSLLADGMLIGALLTRVAIQFRQRDSA